MAPTQNRRKRIKLIYPEFQIRLVVLVTLVLFASNAFLFLQSYFAQSYFSNVARDLGILETHPYFVYLQTQRQKMLMHFCLVSFFSILVSVGGVLFFSHRIAGPIVKLKGHLRRVISGDKSVGDLQFRKGDFFLDLPALVNEALKKK